MQAKVSTWKKVVPARRVTLNSKLSDPASRVTLLAESSLCFSCIQFESLYKKYVES